jgi:hypothetical protein
MPMSKAEAKRKLYEAQAKIFKVYAARFDTKGAIATMASQAVKSDDMKAIEKIIDRCLKRLG